MTGAQWLYLLGSVLTLIGAYLTAKLGAKANTVKAAADKEIGSGQLALSIANRLDREVVALRRFRNQIGRWWSEHEDWDDEVMRELVRLDPTVAKRMGNAPRIPDEPYIAEEA
jgi:hypothetical protein